MKMLLKIITQKVLDYVKDRQAQKQDKVRKQNNREQIRLILQDLQ